MVIILLLLACNLKLNSGAIRLDDVLPPASVTQYDVIRILPFGKVLLVNL